MYSVHMCHYVYTWDTITRASVVMAASLKCTLALGSSLTTAAHMICFALSAYLKNKQTVRIQCRLRTIHNVMYLTYSLSIVDEQGIPELQERKQGEERERKWKVEEEREKGEEERGEVT